MPLPSTMTPIATSTLTAAGATVTFSSVPQTYTDLVLVVSVKTTSGAYPILKMQFNGDTATNYSYTNLIGSATSTVASARSSNIAQMYPGPGIVTAIPDTANTFATGLINIMNYSNSTTYKTVLSRDAVPTNSTGGTGQVGAYVNLWRSTAAVTSITVTTNNGSNYDVGSSFTLYGIKAA